MIIHTLYNYVVFFGILITGLCIGLKEGTFYCTKRVFLPRAVGSTLIVYNNVYLCFWEF